MGIPRDRSFDGTLALLSNPYRFIARRCERNGCDAFETRLMLRPAVCAVGEDAARMFSVPGRFTHRGAAPVTARTLLQDGGSAQTLDDEAHRHRKWVMQSLLAPASVQRLVDEVDVEVRLQARRWETMDVVVLVPELQAVLTRAVCKWAGLSLGEAELARRTQELAATYEVAGAMSPRRWRSRLLRARTQRWLGDVVRDVRTGRLAVSAGSPVDVVARHLELGGEPLDEHQAALELIDLLRPIVATERSLTFVALALYEHPECREPLERCDDAYAGRFAQEVRRVYPFFPVVSGRARVAFEWRGRHFAPGDRVLLDLYGTAHDPRTWDAPDEFDPDRFRRAPDAGHGPIPQSGEESGANHHGAGETLTLEIVKRVAQLLASSLDYDVPPQDLRIDMARIPAVPRSRFRMRSVRLRAPVAERALA